MLWVITRIMLDLSGALFLFVLFSAFWEKYISDKYSTWKYKHLREGKFYWRSYMKPEEFKFIKKGVKIKRVKDKYKECIPGEIYTVSSVDLLDGSHTVYLKELDGGYDLRLFIRIDVINTKDIPWL